MQDPAHVLVAALTRRQTAYAPGVDDWTWFVAVPAAGYAAILAGGLALPSGVAPFAVAGGTTLLVFLGIRNAWDVVTYLTLEHGPDDGG